MALIHKYMAIGNPAAQGDGNTPTTPYLVSNAAEFDSIMRVTLGAGDSHLAAGTYFTRGTHYQETIDGTPPTVMDYGWNIRSNGTITGAGEGNTIVRLDRWPSLSYTAAHQVL